MRQVSLPLQWKYVRAAGVGMELETSAEEDGVEKVMGPVLVMSYQYTTKEGKLMLTLKITEMNIVYLFIWNSSFEWSSC